MSSYLAIITRDNPRDNLAYYSNLLLIFTPAAGLPQSWTWAELRIFFQIAPEFSDQIWQQILKDRGKYEE